MIEPCNSAHLYCDHRIYGVERWVYGDPREVLVRVPDTILNCSHYLGLRDTDGGITRIATGCFVGVSVGVPGLHEYSHMYLVTARHVVDGAARDPRELVVIVNTWDGEALAVTIRERWYLPDNPASDIAVTHMVLRTDLFNYASLNRDMCVTPEEVEKNAIGIGDELMTVGLFHYHAGKQRNLPIVRSGIIASMPHEPLVDDATGEEYHAYLAETRSIGGLSGSPVFVVLPPNRLWQGSREHPDVYTFGLLGLIRGHWTDSPGAMTRAERERFNVGIALVTPITEALEIINGEEDLVKQRKEIERDVRRDGSQVLDSLSQPDEEDDEFERFKDLTRQLANTPKPKPDEDES